MVIRNAQRTERVRSPAAWLWPKARCNAAIVVSWCPVSSAATAKSSSSSTESASSSAPDHAAYAALQSPRA